MWRSQDWLSIITEIKEPFGQWLRMPFVGVLFSTWICQYITLYGMGDHKFVSRKIGRPLSFQVVIWLERQHWRSMTLISSSLKPAWSSALCRWTTHTLSLLSVWRWLKRLSNITIIDYFTWTSNINFHWVTCCHSTGWEPLGFSTRAATRLPATWAFMIRSSMKSILTNSFTALIFRQMKCFVCHLRF